MLRTTRVDTDCTGWVFGVRWTPEFFIKEAVAVGHPFSTFLVYQMKCAGPVSALLACYLWM